VNKSTALNDIKLIIIACVLTIVSCTQESPLDVKPVNLISEEKMVDILIDVHLTESALSLKNFNRDSSMRLYAYYKEDIYQDHKITESQFRESFDYYARHAKKFDAIYAAVIDSIAVKEATGNLE
jgi:hypothetical protein